VPLMPAASSAACTNSRTCWNMRVATPSSADTSILDGTGGKKDLVWGSRVQKLASSGMMTSGTPAHSTTGRAGGSCFPVLSEPVIPCGHSYHNYTECACRRAAIPTTPNDSSIGPWLAIDAVTCLLHGWKRLGRALTCRQQVDHCTLQVDTRQQLCSCWKQGVYSVQQLAISGQHALHAAHHSARKGADIYMQTYLWELGEGCNPYHLGPPVLGSTTTAFEEPAQSTHTRQCSIVNCSCLEPPCASKSCWWLLLRKQSRQSKTRAAHTRRSKHRTWRSL
jgi:hypothetical protein